MFTMSDVGEQTARAPRFSLVNVKRFLWIALSVTIGTIIMALIQGVTGWFGSGWMSGLFNFWWGSVMTAATYEFVLLRQSSH